MLAVTIIGAILAGGLLSYLLFMLFKGESL